MALPTLQELQSKFNGDIIKSIVFPENIIIVDITLDEFINLANKYCKILYVYTLAIDTKDLEEYEYYKDKIKFISIIANFENQLCALIYEDEDLNTIEDEIQEIIKTKERENRKNAREAYDRQLDINRKEFAQILKQDKNFMSLTNNTARQAYIKKEYEDWSHKAGAYFNKDFVEFYNLYIK